MKTSTVRPGSVLILLLVFNPLSIGDDISIQELTDKVFEARYCEESKNFFIAAEQCVVVIDSHTCPTIMKRVNKEATERLGRKDLRFLINTHGHDHIAGNGAYMDLPRIGHDRLVEEIVSCNDAIPDYLERLKDRIIELEEEIGDLPEGDPRAAGERNYMERLRLLLHDFQDGGKIPLPTITFSDRMILCLDDLTIKLIHFGEGHSSADILIHIPEERVLFVGSICLMGEIPPYVLPSLYEDRKNDVERWISVLKGFTDDAIKLDHIIPCHDRSWTKEELVFVHDYYHTLWEGVEKAVHEGLTLDQAKDRLSLREKFRHVKHLQQPDEGVRQKHRDNIGILWRQLQGEV